MKIENIKNIELIKKMTKCLSSEEQVSSYKLFRNIIDEDGIDNYFVIYAYNHLSKRGNERLYMGEKDFWLENILSFICDNDKLFWSIMEHKECFVADEKNGVGYFLNISAAIQDGVIVNKIYAKTLLPISNRNNVYVGEADGAISFDGRNVKENPSYVIRK